MADWGFSPDSSSRTFVYAFVAGQASVQWQMINLQSHTKVLDLSITGISSFWQFSPCGDVLGKVVQTSASFIDVTLYKTASISAPLYSTTLSLGSPIEFRTTASSHIIKVGATDYIMSSNTADAVCTIEPISLKLNPRTVIGGLASTGTVVLNNPAGAGGRVVTLSSNNTGVATVPSSLTVPAGDTADTFTVQTSSVGSVASAVISATAGGVTKRDTLAVLPLSVQSFTFSSGTVLGGDSTTATVTLTGSAGPGGKLVTLTNSNTSLATIPGGIVVPEGSQSGIFTVHTVPVVALDSVTVSASAGGVVIFKTLTILAFPTIRMEKDTVIGGNYGRLIASLSAPAPAGGVMILLQSSIDSIAHPFSPRIIYEGQTEGAVSVRTKAVGTDVTIIITAINAPFPTSATLHVVPANLNSFTSLSDLGCIVGEQDGFKKKYIAGHPIRYRMTLDGMVPSGGAHVTVSIDKPGVVSLADPTDIPEYQDQLSFSTISSDAISTPEVVILAASYHSVTLYDTVTIVPALHYTFVSVHDTSESFSLPVDLNNRGEVLVSTSSGCYVWRDGVRTPSPCGRAMNDSGWIAATEYSGFLRGSAVLYKPDTIHIPALDSDYPYNQVAALNNRGEIAMLSYSVTSSNTLPKISIWRNNAFVYSGSLDPYGIHVMDMNDSGQAAGWAEVSGRPDLPPQLPFVFDGSSLSLVSFPPQVHQVLGDARAINNRGTIVGYWWLTNVYDSGAYQGWFHAQNGVISYLYPLLPWGVAFPSDINDSGVVVGVGWHDYLPIPPTAFIFRDGLTYDLNCLTTLPAGWTLSFATKINNAGEILGENDLGVVRRAFLLRPGTVTDVKEHRGNEKTLPTSYVLSQNYPNPFNPKTDISYQISDSRFVTLTIFDVLGREVATLVNEKKEPGEYSVTWDAGGFASGVYFYRLQTKNFIETKKLILIK